MAITLAAKCAVDEKILADIAEAGINAVELYTNPGSLSNLKEAKQICKKFPFRYAVHAPNDGFEIKLLAELVDAIKAEIIVFHNIYWRDEWEEIIEIFKGIKTRVCVENTYGALEPLKVMRRYGLGLCLDLEHLQMECSGIFEEAFIPFIKKASHIHLTGYIYGSQLWHTHIHQSPQQGIYWLDLLKNVGYFGLIVSEAKPSLQTLLEFKKFNAFEQKWQSGGYK